MHVSVKHRVCGKENTDKAFIHGSFLFVGSIAIDLLEKSEETSKSHSCSSSSDEQHSLIQGCITFEFLLFLFLGDLHFELVPIFRCLTRRRIRGWHRLARRCSIHDHCRQKSQLRLVHPSSNLPGGAFGLCCASSEVH